MEWTKDKVITLIFMNLSSFLAGVALNIPAPFFPKQSELHGVGKAVTGATLGFLPLTEAVFTIIWSKLTFSVGMNNLVNFGVLWTGLTTLALGPMEFIPHEETKLFAVLGILIRTAQGMGTSATLQGAFTILSDTFVVHRSIVMSAVGAMFALGMTSGPAVGSGLYRIGGYWSVFVGSGIFIVLVSVVMFSLVPTHETREKAEVERKMPHKAIFTNTRVMTAVLAYAVSSIAFSATEPLLEPELRHSYGMKEEDSALMYLIIASSLTIGTPIFGKLLSLTCCLDSLLAIAFGIAICAVGFLFAGPFPQFFITKKLWLMSLSLGIIGISYTLIYVAGLDIVYNVESLEIPNDVNRTAVRSLLTSIWRVSGTAGQFFGFVLSGGLGQAIGWEWAMSVFAFIFFVLTIPVFLVKFRDVAKKSCKLLIRVTEEI